ncbi:hypothetical protein CBR_g29483 [Chara braunii]|uniref:Integrase catalytic domain-containing protein n=1 Tax=Chara braunii TaxID=69332 RepID=A0A388LAX5_CHABU|nr:hypothetical protein CBR_g29483 [Chara braunii]|eukprot:GBG79333.1 hypothetical protein CBR_g29483 [Chara braunii]
MNLSLATKVEQWEQWKLESLFASKSMEEMGVWFFWSEMRKDLLHYVETCELCQRNKVVHRAPLSLLQPLPIPDAPAQSVAIDFTDLGRTTPRGMRQVMVCVDRFSKYAEFIPLPEEARVPAVQAAFADRWVTHHGPPTSIVSDRDPRFCSNEWQSYCKDYLHSRLDMTSGRHPEANGQAEVMNQIVYQLLRPVISPDQQDWDLHLGRAQLVYNTSVHSSTGFTPYRLHWGREPRQPLDDIIHKATPRLTPGTAAFTRQYERDIEQARVNLLKAQKAMVQQANKHRRPSPIHAGDWVWVLSSERSREEDISPKLLPRYMGPWQVLDTVGADPFGPPYHVDVPLHLQTYHVFHASKLLPFVPADAFPDRPPQFGPPIPGKGYEVEKVEDEYGTGPDKEYLVKFLYQPHTEDRWFTRKELLKTAKSWLRAVSPRIDWQIPKVELPNMQGVYQPCMIAVEHHRKTSCYCLRAREFYTLSRQYDHERLFLALVKQTDATTVPCPPEVEQVVDKYADLMQESVGLPHRPTKHHIELLPGADPPKGRIYRISPAELEELRNRLETLTSKGWIRPSASEFGAPVLFVPKGNVEFRMCIDYRGLNKITRKSTESLPRIDDLLDVVQGCTLFSKVDLKSGYHQIEMAEEDVHKTTFKTSGEGYHPHLGVGGAAPYGGHPGHVPYGYHGHHQGGGGPYGHPGYSQQMQQMGAHGGGGGGVPPLQAFFAPWEPPPPSVAAPQDVELQNRIAKLVEYAAKNGPQFEALMKEKQKDNPAYGFLFGGEGHEFYRFRLWVLLSQHMQPGVPGVGGGAGGDDPHMAAAYGQVHGGHMPGGPGGFHNHAQQQPDFYNQSMGMHPNAAPHHQPHPHHMHPHMQPHPYDSNYRRMDQQQQKQLAEQHQQQAGDHGYGQQVHGAHPGYGGGEVPGGPHHQHMQGHHYHLEAAGQVQGGTAGYHMENQGAGAGVGGGGGGGSLGPPRGGGLPNELATELFVILDDLTGTKESIKSAKTWFMSRIGYAEQLAEAMRDRIRQLEDPERQLHIVYLANDILFNGFNHRTSPMEMDGIAIAFRPVLGSMLSTIYHCRQNTQSNQDRLQHILHFWGKMEFYDRDTIAALEHEMVTGTPSVYSAGGAEHASLYGMMPPQMGSGHGYYGSTPQHMGWGGSYLSPPLHQQHPGCGAYQQQEEEQRRREEQEEDDRDDKGDDGERDHEKKRQNLEQDWDLEQERRREEDEQSPPSGDGQQSNQDSVASWREERMARNEHNDRYGDTPEGSAGPVKYYPPPGTVTVPYSAGVAATPAGLHAPTGVGLSEFSAGMPAGVAPNAAVSAAVVGMVPTRIPGIPGIGAVAVVPQSVTTGPGDEPLPFPLFPPGLIPGMVRKLQVGSGVPYSPLSPLDIPPVIPPPSVPESYIFDRVQKFFKEVGEIDPLDADEPEKEAAPVRQEREEEEEPEMDTGPFGGLGLGMMTVDPETGTLPDGSVAIRPGMITSGKLGLGAMSDPNEITQYDDVYLSYRKQRSTNYHTSLGLRAMEVLLNALRADPRIQGLDLGTGHRLLTGAIADDLLLVMEATTDSTREAKRLLDAYAELLEARVNWNKSLYFLPPDYDLEGEDWGMKRIASNLSEHYLGIQVALTDARPKQDSNLRAKAQASLPRCCSAVGVALMGRALLITSTVFAQLWYVAAIFLISKATVRQLTSEAARYLWKPSAENSKSSPEDASSGPSRGQSHEIIDGREGVVRPPIRDVLVRGALVQQPDGGKTSQAVENKIANAGTAPFEIRNSNFLCAERRCGGAQAEEHVDWGTSAQAWRRVSYFSGTAPPPCVLCSSQAKRSGVSSPALATCMLAALPWFRDGGRTLPSRCKFCHHACLPHLVVGVFDRRRGHSFAQVGGGGRCSSSWTCANGGMQWGAVLSRTERTGVAAAAVAVVRRYEAERAAGRMKAALSRRRHRLLLQRVLDAPDCITTSEAEVQLCAAIGSSVLPRATPRWWMRRRTGGTWEDLRVCNDATDDYFWEKLRMSRRVFMEITEACAPHLQRQVTFYREPLQPDQIVAYALYRWATGESYDNSTSSFGIGRASGDKGFPNCHGAVDCTHIYVDKPANAPSENYFDRKHCFSVIVQVVVDLDLRVLDVFVGYPGNCHDIRVIQLSSLSKRAEEGTLFRGPPVMLSGGVRTNGCILGDNGYPPSEWIVVPYGGINQHPDEERFDNKQKVARGAVERAFGRLKGMWRLFLQSHKTNLDTLLQQFTVVCILHNILLDAGIEFDENLLWEVDENGVRWRVDLGIHRPLQPVTMLTSTDAAHVLRNALAERMKHI